MKRFLSLIMAVSLVVAGAVPVRAASVAETNEEIVRMGYYPEAGMMNGAEEGAVKSGYAYEYAHCPVRFAATPENSALMAVINKSAPFVTDVQMNEIQNRYSSQDILKVSTTEFLRTHPEIFIGIITAMFAIALMVVLYKWKKDRAYAAKKKESDFYKSVIERFSADYEAVFLGNLQDGSYKELTSKDGFKTIFTGNDTIVTVSERFLNQSVHPVDREKIRREMIPFDEIKSRLPVGESHNLEYRSRTDDGYLWYRTNLSRISEDEVIIGFKECDEEILGNHITEMLMDDYASIYVVDLEKDEVRPTKKSKVTAIGNFEKPRSYKDIALQFSETVAPEYKQDWIDFSDVNYLKQYMSKDNHREYVYELPVADKKMRRFSVDVIERVDGVATLLLFSFMGIDDYRAQVISLHKTMSEQKVLLDYFVESYDSAYFIDLSKMSYEILHMNPEFTKIFGSCGEGEEGMKLFIEKYVHPDDRDLILQVSDKEYVKNRLKEEPSFGFTIREVFDGEEKNMRGIIVRGSDEDHVAVGFMDITAQVIEQKEAEKQLQEALSMAQAANRAKTIFLNSMSHDIRTPMNAIIGFTNLASKHSDNKEQVEDYLKKIGQSSDHLLSLINDVLDMSRIESGKMHLDEKTENLFELIATLKDIVQADVEAKQHDFSVDMVDVKDENIICDKLRVNQVLLNIVSNAVKYTDNGGKISMRITEKEVKISGYATYEFCVKDNGMGMTQEYLKTIFDPFSRVKSSTVSGIQGTGLGMAITKNIVDMMGGKIEVNSELGEGTEITVVFDFKLQKDRRELTPEAIAEEINAASKKESEECDFYGKKILLVEDNEFNREIATELLSEYGFVLDTAEDGDIAVDKIKNAAVGDYDLILMDIQMPTIDGYEATRQIRNLGTDISRIPIIAMTANAFEEDRKAALQVGMNDHIPKPIDIKVLKSVLAKFL